MGYLLAVALEGAVAFGGHQIVPVGGEVDFDGRVAAAGHNLDLVAGRVAGEQYGRHPGLHSGDGHHLVRLAAVG